ncbi:type II/IV secretion system protein [bacterium]|nr:type II/IV secretion system protein [bacterium]
MPLPYTGVDMRLLAALVERGLIKPEISDQIKLECAQQNKSELQIILEKKLVTELDLYKTKAAVYNVQFIEDLSVIQTPAELLAGINIDALKEQQSFPFEMDETRVKIVMADPFNINAIQFWKIKYLPRQIEVYTSTPSAVFEYINTRFGSMIGGDVQAAVSKYQQESGTKETVISTDDVDDVSQNLQGAPVAKIVNSILVYAAQSGASDIHIEPQERSVRIRYRIDGVLTEKLTLPRELLSPVIARIKIMSNMKIDETRLPQDDRLFITVGERKFDLRVSTLPSVQGEKVVMRLLERTTGIPPLEESGLRGSGYKRYIESVSLTNGIVLVTGPTGSGKTRTLASTVARLNDPKVNIISIEDPVEIRISGVTQVQVNHDIGLDFATVLRSVLRQDPNIVYLGEIRDEETARLAIRAALTGHLVLSTLHTNGAVSSLIRLIDMGIEPFLVASTVKCVVGQRLVRTICPHCREAILATPEMIAEITHILGGIQNFDVFRYVEALSKRTAPAEDSPEYKFSPPVKPPEMGPEGRKTIYLYKGAGCTKCGNTGYKGRMAIFEVATVTDKMASGIARNAEVDTLEKMAEEEGMITMVQDGFLKAIEGITTIEEVARVAKSDSELM